MTISFVTCYDAHAEWIATDVLLESVRVVDSPKTCEVMMMAWIRFFPACLVNSIADIVYAVWIQ